MPGAARPGIIVSRPVTTRATTVGYSIAVAGRGDRPPAAGMPIRSSVDRPEGLTKLILDRATGRILGVGLAGAGAGELIAEGVLAIEMGATAEDLKLTIHPHPTLSETLMEAAETFFGQSTHVYKPKKR